MSEANEEGKRLRLGIEECEAIIEREQSGRGDGETALEAADRILRILTGEDDELEAEFAESFKERQAKRAPSGIIKIYRGALPPEGVPADRDRLVAMHDLDVAVPEADEEPEAEA